MAILNCERLRQVVKLAGTFLIVSIFLEVVTHILSSSLDLTFIQPLLLGMVLSSPILILMAMVVSLIPGLRLRDCIQWETEGNIHSRLNLSGVVGLLFNSYARFAWYDTIGLLIQGVFLSAVSGRREDARLQQRLDPASHCLLDSNWITLFSWWSSCQDAWQCRCRPFDLPASSTPSRWRQFFGKATRQFGVLPNPISYIFSLTISANYFADIAALIAGNDVTLGVCEAVVNLRYFGEGNRPLGDKDCLLKLKFYMPLVRDLRVASPIWAGLS